MCDVRPHAYFLGKQRIFFRMGAAAFLEELLDADVEEMRPVLLRKYEVYTRKANPNPNPNPNPNANPNSNPNPNHYLTPNYP